MTSITDIDSNINKHNALRSAVQNWFRVNPGLKFNPCFNLRTSIQPFVFKERKEKKTSIDPGKIFENNIFKYESWKNCFEF